MTDERSLPSGPIHTVYLDTGEEVAVYSGSDFGNQPDWDKRAMTGWGLVIRGVSSETFHEDGSNIRFPARSVLYNVIDGWFTGADGTDTFSDGPETDPWGMMFSDATENPNDWGTSREAKDTSVLLKQVRSEMRKNGGRPFLSSMTWIETVPAKGNMPAQGYYKLQKYTRNASPLPKE